MAIIWEVIRPHPIRDRADVEDALAKVRQALEALDVSEVRNFNHELKQALENLDRPALAGMRVVLPDGTELEQTADSFLYARCACILTGRAAMEEAFFRGKFDDYL